MNSELILKLILKEEGRIDELEKERTQNLETIQRQTKEIDELRESLNKTQLELGEEKKTAQQPHPNVMNRIKTQLEYIRKLEDEAAKNDEDIQLLKEYKNAREHHVEYIRKLENEADEKDEEIRWLKEEKNEHQRPLEYIRELEDLLAQRDETIQSLKYGRNVLAAEKTIQKLTKEKEDLAGQLEIVKGKNEQMGRRMSEQQADLIEMTKRNEALQAALDKLQERFDLHGATVTQQNEMGSKDIEVQTEAADSLMKGLIVMRKEEIEKTTRELVVAQERIKFLEDKYVPEVISLSEKKAELEAKLKAAEEQLNELRNRCPVGLRHKLTDSEKMKREAYIQRFIENLKLEYSRVVLNANEKSLEEQAREMAEKTVQSKELNQEVMNWRIEMNTKQPNIFYQAYWPTTEWDIIYY